ncbi:MAG: hypothetical protein [Cressdnaviricota sp.]|nr:MAG: hypothetical protein [Cressdnaviricota sp.]
MNFTNEYRLLNKPGREVKLFDKCFTYNSYKYNTPIPVPSIGLQFKGNESMWWNSALTNFYNFNDSQIDPVFQSTSNVLTGLLGEGTDAGGLEEGGFNISGAQFSRIGRTITPIGITIKIMLSAALLSTVQQAVAPFPVVQGTPQYNEGYCEWGTPRYNRYYVRTTYKVCIIKDHSMFEGNKATGITWNDVFENGEVAGIRDHGPGVDSMLANQRLDTISKYEVLEERLVHLTGDSPQELLTFNVKESNLGVVGYKRGFDEPFFTNANTTYGIHLVWSAWTIGVANEASTTESKYQKCQLPNPICSSRLYYEDS